MRFWKTYLRLGFGSLCIVFAYRLAKRWGLFRFLCPVDGTYSKDLFFGLDATPLKPNRNSNRIVEEAEQLLAGRVRYFSNEFHAIGAPPNWFLNPFLQKTIPNPERHWSLLDDFNEDIGDIKCIWEVSRFDWALVLSRAYRGSGEKYFLHTLNEWISDWGEKNPSNIGVNWKCGQEVSIRMMQVLLSAFILRQHKKPSTALVQFVEAHCRRIKTTLRYAISQNNNHGTSEAAALFVAGVWLFSLDSKEVDRGQAKVWKALGRFWLENRVSVLVEKDGSFSQYSVNYHRVLLDTLSYAEFWRRELGDAPFGSSFYSHARAATKWLYVFTNEKTGDAPNIGANDGARLFNLSAQPFRDFRPTVQLASRLFYRTKAYQNFKYEGLLSFLMTQKEGVETSEPLKKESALFDGGGYCYLRQGECEIFIRYPRFRFRPGHADALHLDLWHKGFNVIRDGGSYSYNNSGSDDWMAYFSGTKAHSTVEFDDRDQMPRVSRFLYGDWLTTKQVDPIKDQEGVLSWSAHYQDYKGAEHRREVMLKDNRITVSDFIKGFSTKAILRWRLHPENWFLKENVCSSVFASFDISSDVTFKRIELCEGYESRYYMEKSILPVLEVEVAQDAKITTVISLN